MKKIRTGFLSVGQVGKFLNCSRQHVYNLIKQGELPNLKIGGSGPIRVQESKLETFLKRRELEEGLF